MVRARWLVARRDATPDAPMEPFGMNIVFRDILLAQAKYLLNRSGSIRRLDHNGLEGDLREAFIQDFLIPLLPEGFGVGRGKAISSHQQTSKQIDCLIYNRSILAPAFAAGVSGVFPIESTLMTIEVKSTLNATELRTSHSSAAELSKFIHAPPVGLEQHSGDHIIEHVIPCIFAYGSDLVVGGKSETARYDEIRGKDEPFIRMICVVSRGLWFWSDDKWSSWSFDFEHSEIAGFAAAIANTCERISQTRRRPDFRAYLGWNAGTTPTVAHLVQG
jgi:hypothetical protein